MRAVRVHLGFLVLAAGSLLAQTPATLTAAGYVKVNGQPVSGRSTLFSNDHVETGTGTANIALRGALYQLSENSTFLFKEDLPQLGCGSTLLSATGATVLYTQNKVIV